uniref:Secreted protein n=1 Tax=Ixodes ricinus TaxID=34613 RepID=A0A6B0U2S4_IXORI
MSLKTLLRFSFLRSLWAFCTAKFRSLQVLVHCEQAPAAGRLHSCIFHFAAVHLRASDCARLWRINFYVVSLVLCLPLFLHWFTLHLLQ